eukprot:4758034-Amphidinium_carterae.1
MAFLCASNLWSAAMNLSALCVSRSGKHSNDLFPSSAHEFGERPDAMIFSPCSQLAITCGHNLPSAASLYSVGAAGGSEAKSSALRKTRPSSCEAFSSTLALLWGGSAHGASQHPHELAAGQVPVVAVAVNLQVACPSNAVPQLNLSTKKVSI